MPRPDGKLYPSEIDALKTKPERPAKTSAKAKPVKVVEKVEVIEPPKGVICEDIAPSRGGRPVVLRKLTPEIVKQVLNDIEQGLPQDSALVLAGISREALEKWKRVNPSLRQRFAESEAKLEKALVANVRSLADQKDLKANQFILERRVAGWAPLTKTELTGKDGKDLATSFSKELMGLIARAPDAADRAKRVTDVQVVSK